MQYKITGTSEEMHLQISLECPISVSSGICLLVLKCVKHHLTMLFHTEQGTKQKMHPVDTVILVEHVGGWAHKSRVILCVNSENGSRGWRHCPLFCFYEHLFSTSSQDGPIMLHNGNYSAIVSVFLVICN